MELATKDDIRHWQLHHWDASDQRQPLAGLLFALNLPSPHPTYRGSLQSTRRPTIRAASSGAQIPLSEWPEKNKFHRFISEVDPSFEEYEYTDLGYLCKTPDKFNGAKKDGVHVSSSRLQFTLPVKHEEPKTIEFLRSSAEKGYNPIFGAVEVKLPLGATVVARESRLVFSDVKAGSNAANSWIMKDDILRAVSVPEIEGSEGDTPWWGKLIGQAALPPSEEGMVFLDGKSEAEYRAVIDENTKQNQAAVVVLVERPPKQKDVSFVPIGDKKAPDEFGPRCVAIGGYSEDEMERVEDVLDSVGLNAIELLPLIVLAQEDGKIRLKDLLSSRLERDHVLPSKKAMNIQPFILFSGIPMSDVRQVLGRMPSLKLPACAACIAVPNAMEKPMKQLTTEVIDDFIINRDS